MSPMRGWHLRVSHRREAAMLNAEKTMTRSSCRRRFILRKAIAGMNDKRAMETTPRPATLPTDVNPFRSVKETQRRVRLDVSQGRKPVTQLNAPEGVRESPDATGGRSGNLLTVLLWVHRISQHMQKRYPPAALLSLIPMLCCAAISTGNLFLNVFEFPYYADYS
jgi:hypothetical protein